MSRTRVLIADPARIFRSGVRALLVRESDFAVLEAGDLDGVTAIIADEAPDIALIDVDLPPLGGLAALRRVVSGGQTRAIVWAADVKAETILAAVCAGASGCLHKQISPQGLLRALRGVARGEAPLSRDLATLMIDALQEHEERERTRERAALLSAREREVLDLVSTGAANKQIARTLYISEFTVKRHMQNILQKLELPSRRDAAALYRAASADENGHRVTSGTA